MEACATKQSTINALVLSGPSARSERLAGDRKRDVRGGWITPHEPWALGRARGLQAGDKVGAPCRRLAFGPACAARSWAQQPRETAVPRARAHVSRGRGVLRTVPTAGGSVHSRSPGATPCSVKCCCLLGSVACWHQDPVRQRRPCYRGSGQRKVFLSLLSRSTCFRQMVAQVD